MHGLMDSTLRRVLPSDSDVNGKTGKANAHEAASLPSQELSADVALAFEFNRQKATFDASSGACAVC